MALMLSASADWPTTGVHWLDTVITSCVVLAILGGGVQALRAHVIKPLRGLHRQLMLFLEDWGGDPPRVGVPGRPGVMERFAAIEANQKAVNDESRRTRSDVQEALVANERRTAASFADIDVRLAVLEQQVAGIHHETQPNGGSSMKDQLNRLDPAVPDEPREGPSNDDHRA